ncbi:hypothetical protein OE88DRAFT_976995 [Heliocybe sulcata]|uniref:Uncharacterized protein n=1 Tax=Heliocybe sulcata TaxID=5364 RepID=A0A5C3NC68_9AGAM|nr:hypothetical protein OE88DRAFT_976995 [Heliocybe sulcata]
MDATAGLGCRVSCPRRRITAVNSVGFVVCFGAFSAENQIRVGTTRAHPFNANMLWPGCSYTVLRLTALSRATVLFGRELLVFQDISFGEAVLPSCGVVMPGRDSNVVSIVDPDASSALYWIQALPVETRNGREVISCFRSDMKSFAALL